MDKSERARLKQLANDAIIATFGQDTSEARLAQALEQCVDELEDANAKCPTCSVCEDHGDLEDESIEVDVNELLRIHREMKPITEHLQRTYDTEATEKLESLVSELYGEIIP